MTNEVLSTKMHKGGKIHLFFQSLKGTWATRNYLPKCNLEFSKNTTSDECSRHTAPPPTTHPLLKWIHSRGCEVCLKKVRLLAFHLKSTEKFFTKEVRSLRLFSQAPREFGIARRRSIWSGSKGVVWRAHCRSNFPTSHRFSAISSPVHRPWVTKFLHKAVAQCKGCFWKHSVLLISARIIQHLPAPPIPLPEEWFLKIKTNTKSTYTPSRSRRRKEHAVEGYFNSCLGK